MYCTIVNSFAAILIYLDMLVGRFQCPIRAGLHLIGKNGNSEALVNLLLGIYGVTSEPVIQNVDG